MEPKFDFSSDERIEALSLYAKLKDRVGDSLLPGDEQKMRHHLMQLMDGNHVIRNIFGLNPILLSLQTALLLV